MVKTIILFIPSCKPPATKYNPNHTKTYGLNMIVDMNNQKISIYIFLITRASPARYFSCHIQYHDLHRLFFPGLKWLNLPGQFGQKSSYASASSGLLSPQRFNCQVLYYYNTPFSLPMVQAHLDKYPSFSPNKNVYFKQNITNIVNKFWKYT